MREAPHQAADVTRREVRYEKGREIGITLLTEHPDTNLQSRVHEWAPQEKG